MLAVKGSWAKGATGSDHASVRMGSQPRRIRLTGGAFKCQLEPRHRDRDVVPRVVSDVRGEDGIE
jgi:hypothetical protein